jgi:hypothetical protein
LIIIDVCLSGTLQTLMSEIIFHHDPPEIKAYLEVFSVEHTGHAGESILF